MEARARRQHRNGRKTDLFKIMEKHGRDRLTSGIWERALEAEDPLATELIERAVGALGTGIASVINLLDVEAVSSAEASGRGSVSHTRRRSSRRWASTSSSTTTRPR